MVVSVAPNVLCCKKREACAALGMVTTGGVGGGGTITGGVVGGTSIGGGTCAVGGDGLPEPPQATSIVRQMLMMPFFREKIRIVVMSWLQPNFA